MRLWKSIAIQVTILVVICYLFAFALANLESNANRLGVTLGFDFLKQAAGFPISEQWLNYQPSDSNAMVWLVGVVNMLVVSITACCSATVIGMIIAFASMSTNTLISTTSVAYIEIFRNIPLLLQILFWYNFLINKLPKMQNSWYFGSVLMNNRGIFMPVFPLVWEVLIIFIILAGFAKVLNRHVSRWHSLTIFATVLVLWWGISAGWAYWSNTITFPVQRGFQIRHAWHIHPEFLGLWLGLSFYTAAFCAEIFRAGLLAVPKGQYEASTAMGLSLWQRYREVLLPQALPAVLPPLTSQYINVQKNASLGVTVGYPELFAVFAGTVLNQTGRAVEIMLITMVTYYTLSSLLSLSMRKLNQRFSIWTATAQG